jgi:type II secretory pathway component PulM
VARRRIKLSLDRPLAALWETVGWCGSPPRDTSSLMAAIAIALTVAGWLLIPVGLFLVVALF